MRTAELVTQRRARQKKRSMAVFVWALIGLSSSAAAQTAITAQPKMTKVDMLTWDLPEQMDNQPGAVIVDVTGDSNRLWFVTRILGGAPGDAPTPAPRVYRLELKGGKKVNNAQWLSWSLDASGGIANGVRRIKTSGDKRYVFVHTQASMQRIDTQSCSYSAAKAIVSCTGTVWLHQTADDPTPINLDHTSDLAIDESNNNVYAAIGAINPDQSFIQRLNPNATSSNATRWYVGGGVGICSSAEPCLSGVAIDRRSRDLVYYSEPTGGPDGNMDGVGDGAIGEINTRTNLVRRWFFADLKDPTVREPRQLQFDNDGRLWTVTASGHLVSLDPKKSLMSKHRMPAVTELNASPFRDPFGVAPDGGLIGYTDAAIDDSRVGMLMPDRDRVFVKPIPDDHVIYRTVTLEQTPIFPNRTSGSISPNHTTVPGQIVRNEDGTWSEAKTSVDVFGQPAGNVPLGITPDQTAKQGTFFFAVGDPAQLVTGINRIARVRLPKAELRGHDNRDDDDVDDDGKRADTDDDVDDDGMPNHLDSDSDNDGVPDTMDDDDDDDGIEDSWDTKDKKERKQTSDQDVAAGDTADVPFTLNAGTLVVVASAVASNALAPVKIEILNAAGTVVASSLSVAGAATLTYVPPAAGGDYTMRVRNQSVGATSIATTLLTRELWPVLF